MNIEKSVVHKCVTCFKAKPKNSYLTRRDRRHNFFDIGVMSLADLGFNNREILTDVLKQLFDVV